MPTRSGRRYEYEFVGTDPPRAETGVWPKLESYNLKKTCSCFVCLSYSENVCEHMEQKWMSKRRTSRFYEAYLAHEAAVRAHFQQRTRRMYEEA